MNPKSRAGRRAGRQYGAISGDQARSCGLTKNQVRQLVRSGRWRSAARGVYVVSGATPAWEQSVMIAVLACGARAAASHSAAAYILGLVDRPPERIDVTVALSANGRGRGVHRVRSFARSDVRTVRGIPVTCPARTLVDLASVLPQRRLGAALDRALLKGLVTIGVVRRYIADRGLTRLRGVGVLVRLLDDRELGVPESELEREFLDLAREHNLPRPSRQERVGKYRVDFMYVDARIVIEVDGRATHGTALAFEEDPVRQNALTLGGWKVYRFTWTQVTQQPEYVADTVRRALDGSRRGAVGNPA